MSEPRAVRLGLSLVAGCATAAVAYAVARTAQALGGAEPDLALVFYSEHAGYVWRALTAGYVGGSAAFATWLLTAHDAARVARVLVRLVPAAALVSAAQGLLIP